MQDRYALRFESGEREGEVHALRAGTTTVGRRPGSDLQVLDASVSSRHAELVLDERGVLLRDLGSTNGTRVGGERVLETRLAHGDALAFGNVRFAFLDRSLAEPARVPAGEREDDALGRVSSEQLARSRRRPALGFVLALVALAAAGGGAWWWLRGRGADEGRQRLRAVVAVEGNRLDADPSFELDADGFEAEAEAPASFSEREGARHGGRVGLGVDLAPGEWALQRSAAVRVLPGRRVEARAALRARGDVRVRLGIELAGQARGEVAAPGRATAWSAPAEPDAGWAESVLTCTVPPGFGEARLVVRASAGGASGAAGEESGGGDAAFDDVVLLESAGGAQADLTVAEHRLHLLGEPAREAVLYHVDRLLLTGLGLHERREGGADEPLAFGLEAVEQGARLLPREAPPGDSTLRVVARLEPALLAGGLGTLGEGGWRGHGASFERQDVTLVLAGSEHRLVGLRVEPPAAVRGVAEGEGARLEIALAPQATVLVQLDFQAERRAADERARRARAAQERGELGRALAGWQELVERSPFEPALVREAQEARSRLVDEGLAEVARLEAEVERARFFDLADLFRRSRDEVAALGRRYAGSEVEEAADALGTAIAAELSARAERLDGGEDRRLARIEAALVEQGASRLAEAVRSWREELARGDEPGAATSGEER